MSSPLCCPSPFASMLPASHQDCPANHSLWESPFGLRQPPAVPLLNHPVIQGIILFNALHYRSFANVN